MGVYDRTISLFGPSGCGRVAVIEICCPMGSPRMAVAEGSLNR
jgi:hypothetical protein